MKIWTTTELQTLSRAQLLALLEEVLAELTNLAPGSAEYADMLALLADIRAALARRQPSRCRPLKPPAP